MANLAELQPQFTDDELKLLLVAVRQMRRMFAAARRQSVPPPGSPPDAASLETYAALYDDLFEKLRGMAGPILESVDSDAPPSAM